MGGVGLNNKILIGSIIAITILIGVSFTSVVGYNSVESDIEASPLFNIRSSRAIDEESKDLACEYVGKGEISILSISGLNENKELLQLVTDKIKCMDDKTFNRFLTMIINKIQYSNEYKSVNINEVITFLHRLRDKNEISIDNDTNNGNLTYNDTPTLCWFPGCIIIWIYVSILGFIFRSVSTVCIACGLL